MSIQTQAVVSALLGADGEMYGLQIAQATALPTGSIYAILKRLHGAGWVTTRWEPRERARDERRPARRYYALSPAGRDRACTALDRASGRRGHLARLLDLVPESRGPVTASGVPKGPASNSHSHRTPADPGGLLSATQPDE